MKHVLPCSMFLALFVLASGAAPVRAADELPQTTPEGMQLVKQTRSRIVYAMPGATLDDYTRVALIDCYVAFAKDWQRDYNRDATLQRQVRPDDIERIKASLADEFRKVFTEELTSDGREVVDHTGDDVLIIRPAIIDLDITAPDVKFAGFERVIVRSAGEMTLYMELFDSVTGAIIARVIDAQESDMGLAREANRVTNKAEADKILRGWARELADHLGETQKDTAAGDGE